MSGDHRAIALVMALRGQGITDQRVLEAMEKTPRAAFVDQPFEANAYENTALPIACGQTISQPYIVAYITAALELEPKHRVLEIGTGSGYQSAYLSNLTDKVHTVEIIDPLATRTRGIYDGLVGRGYSQLSAIASKSADGYYGWEGVGDFDKIIVTCGIDHIPPSLLQQLKPDGVMVIPVGPPGAQHVLKVVKQKLPDGTFNIVRSDIYNGKVVPFVPFTKLEGEQIVGTHNG